MLLHSECASEWFDCIEEDETYIREKGFYKNCTPTTKNSEVPDELLDVTKDKCFENRKCQADIDGDSEELFVGGSSKCKCEKSASNLNRTLISSERYKRQTGEVFRTSARVRRVFKARLGGRRLARDEQQLTRRKGDYILIRQGLMDYTESFKEEDFDLIG